MDVIDTCNFQIPTLDTIHVPDMHISKPSLSVKNGPWHMQAQCSPTRDEDFELTAGRIELHRGRSDTRPPRSKNLLWLPAQCGKWEVAKW
jgi:hypothetical protein